MILLLHAFPLNHQMYSLLQQELYDAGEEVFAPDFPGFGGAPGEIPSLDEYARSLLDQLPQEDVVGLGLSMGGYVLMRLLELAPERFKGVILANTRMGADPAEGKLKRLQMAEKVLQQGVGVLPELMLEGLIGKDAPEDIQDSVRTMMSQATPQGVAAAQRAMAGRPDSSEVLSRLQVPVLVIAGTEDTLIPLEASREMAKASKATLLELPTAHLSNLLEPERFNAAVLKFLKSV